MVNVPAAFDVTQAEEMLKVPEIRVWCHPKGGGDDHYHVFASFKEAFIFIKDNRTRHNDDSDEFKTEKAPLVAFRGYELNLFAITQSRHKWGKR